MNYLKSFSVILLLCSIVCVPGFGGSNYQKHPFRVGDSSFVYFSPGNLQYRATSGDGTPLMHKTVEGMAQGEYRFAPNQWEFVLSFGTDNTDIWKSWFAFGTSGYNNMYPWLSYNQTYRYQLLIKANIDNTNYDWGVYNQIGNDAPGTWRTLSINEWNVLFNREKDGKYLYGFGRVNSVTGVILLPDDWDVSQNFNYGNKSYSSNTYSRSDWENVMEPAGGVFLPAAKSSTGNFRFNNEGGYASSSISSDSWTYFMGFNNGTLNTLATNPMQIGEAVRLVQNTDKVKEPATTCDNVPYIWEGHNVQIGLLPAGVYTIWDSLKTIHGCDSIYKLTLTVYPTFFHSDSVSICENTPFVWENHPGVTIPTLPGTYTLYDSLLTVHGCDSVYELRLTIHPVYFASEAVSTCDNVPYIWVNHPGVTIPTLPGTYTLYDSLQTVHGCDSVFELRLTIHPAFIAEIPIEACESKDDTFVWGGQQINLHAAGTYNATEVLKTSYGCDSIRKLVLTVWPSYYFEE